MTLASEIRSGTRWRSQAEFTQKFWLITSPSHLRADDLRRATVCGMYEKELSDKIVLWDVTGSVQFTCIRIKILQWELVQRDNRELNPVGTLRNQIR